MAKEGPVRLAVMLSGRGSNFEALQTFLINNQGIHAQIVGVVSDQPTAKGLDRAQGFGIPTWVVERANHPSKEAFEAELHSVLQSLTPDWVVLAGFMRILGPTLLQPWAGRMINIHPSLLPRHRGLNTHQRVLEAKEGEHGASIHFVTQELDGGPVLSQVMLDVTDDDTPDTLAEHLLPLEHRLMKASVALLVNKAVQCQDGEIKINGFILKKPLLLGRDFDDCGELMAAAIEGQS